MRKWQRAAGGTALVLIAGTLSSCQMGASEGLSLKSKENPTELMVAIGKAALECWFKSKDPAFVSYKMADETHSLSGRPRLLLVPRNDPGALPRLVIQAETRGSAASGTYTDIQTYGPALSSLAGARITTDVKRWASGNTSCN